MRKFFYFLLLSFYLPVFAQDWIRVRIHSGQVAAYYEGLNFRFNNLQRAYQPIAIPRKSRLQILRIKLPAGNEKTWAWQINLSEDALEAKKIFHQRVLLVQGQDIIEAGRLRPGLLMLAANSEGAKFDIIAVVPLEQYVAGVVASEMPSPWPLQALKAQAVAARSYAVATMKERISADYHVESTVLDQVFTHLSRDQISSAEMKRVLQAVSETEGQLLQADFGQALKSYYHSDCGGKTSTSAQVWGSGVNFGTAIDRSCPRNPKAQWMFSVAKKNLQASLEKRFGPHPNGFTKILLHREKLGEKLGERVREKSDERVSEIEVFWRDGFVDRIKANEFRAILGYSQLRSTQFSMAENQGEFVFRGSGFGHGVGMCQWGARALAMAGNSYTTILQHYYPKANLFQNPAKTRSAKNSTAETAIKL